MCSVFRVWHNSTIMLWYAIFIGVGNKDISTIVTFEVFGEVFEVYFGAERGVYSVKKVVEGCSNSVLGVWKDLNNTKMTLWYTFYSSPSYSFYGLNTALPFNTTTPWTHCHTTSICGKCVFSV